MNININNDNVFLELFYQLNRKIHISKLYNFLDNCWLLDPIKTIAIIFNSRDRNNGKKDKQISNLCMIWLRLNKEYTYKLNIKKYVMFYGCWNDLLYINFITNKGNSLKYMEDYELILFAQQLINDKNNNSDNISLCCKWAPTEKDRNDKKQNTAFRLSKILFPDNNNSLELYRKIYITPLRKKLDVLEVKTSNNEWNKINYNKVPYKAHKNYKKSFIKHDKERYIEYIKTKTFNYTPNTDYLPDEIVNKYLNEKLIQPYDEKIEKEWKTLIENIKQKNVFNNTVSVLDINNKDKLSLSLGLSLLISECCTGYYNNKIISYTNNPNCIEIIGDNLNEKLKFLINNIYSEEKINYRKLYQIINKKLINKIVILTDKKYETNKTKPPANINIVYYNVSSTFQYETQEKINIINGTHQQILKTFINEGFTNSKDIMNYILKDYYENIKIDNNDNIYQKLIIKNNIESDDEYAIKNIEYVFKELE